LRRDLPMHAAVLETLTQPQPLSRTGNVRELGRELSAVNLSEQREDVVQLHPRVPGSSEPAGVELAVEIRRLDTEEVELQHGRRMPLPQAERIEVRDLVAAQAIDLDQPRDGRLLLARRRIGGRRDARGRGRRLSQPLADRLADRPVRNLAAVRTYAAEEAAPSLRNAIRRFEIDFVKRLDERGICTLLRSRLVLLLALRTDT